MNKNFNELDEMQVHLRNKIGNQSFFILFFLLLGDTFLRGLGVEWIAYPINIFIIINGIMLSYLIRIIRCNALLGPKKPKRILGVKLIIGFALSAAIASLGILVKGNGIAPVEDGNGAMILLIFSLVGLVIVGVVQLIQHFNGKASLKN